MRLRTYITIVGALLFGSSLQATDVAVLRNGFSIRHERCEVTGNVTRLYLQSEPNSGYVDVPTAQIVEIDPAPADAVPTSPAIAGPNSVRESIDAASQRTGIDRDLIESVIHSESSFNPKALSPKGAQGLMQLMPETAKQLGVQDSFDPAANVDGGSRYLRGLLLQYHSNLAKALAAYNAGPQRVAQYNGVPPFRETYSYVSRVIREFNRKKLAEQQQERAARVKTAQAPVSTPTSLSSSERSGGAQ